MFETVMRDGWGDNMSGFSVFKRGSEKFFWGI